MSSQRNNQLLQEATDAARDGDRVQARRLLQQLLSSDSTNVKAWTLMYRVSDSTEDKKQALEQILKYDPGNIKAQEALDRLETRVREAEEEEVAPGINRRQLMLIFGGLALVALVVLGGAVLLININNNNRRDEFNTATAFVAQQSEVAALETGSIQTVTQAIIDATGTFYALNSPTPTPTNTRAGPPTLPPEFTPTYTPLPAVTPTNLPPPPDAAGIIIGYGGPDLLNDGYYPIVTMGVGSINIPRAITTGAETRGLNATSNNSGQIIYTQYSRQTFEQTLVSIDVNGGNTQFLTDLWKGTAQGIMLNPDQANLSADGTKLVFVANAGNNRNQIFVFSFDAAGGDPVQRLVNDEFDYSYPVFSPDGTQVLAVRTNSDPNNPGTDLFQITVNSGELRPITTDGALMIETTPRYSPDGREIAYAAAPDARSPHDIWIRNSDGSGQALDISNNDADEIYPVYAPDGRYLAFTSNRTLAYNVYIFDRANGALFQITGGRDSYFPTAWVSN